MTLMDFIRGGQGKGKASDQSVPGVVSPMPNERQLADPEPLPKVSAPKYLSYKADAARLVRTAGFAASAATDGSKLLVQAKVAAPNDIASALEAFYGHNGAPLWVSAGDVNDKAKAVVALLSRADEFGLDPADYAVTVPALTTASITPPAAPVPAADAPATAAPADASAAAAASSAPAPAAPTGDASAAAAPATAAPPAAPATPALVSDEHGRELMQFELALSAKALMFAQDMVRGRLDPNRISEYHDFKRKNVDLAATLSALQTGADDGAYLSNLGPKNSEFEQLKAELARLKTEVTNEQTAIKLPDNLLLKPGASSPELANVVAAIQHAGSEAFKTKFSATLTGYQQTPDYTPDLVDMVKGFQSEKGLKADGVIGNATVRKMVGETVEDKVQKVVVAMEQARWLPADLGPRYVLINQAAFRVYYHENGQEQFSMRAVVGAKAHQTFFFQDQIQTVEFNPYWGVPQSIIINEMLPRLRQDAGYLDRLGYEVTVNGKAVPSSSVNWYGSVQNVGVRQPPSSDNALGDLKILFPNAHAIYMHDTPAKSFFNRDMRALSHGCVRLQEPRKMAAAVLGISQQEVDARIAGGKNEAAKVPTKFPVYVAYFTAWPNKDGHVEYFGDVYDRDQATLKALDITSKARSTQI
ncbi:MAG: L,D-transpeptidase family protein [Neorhizobium sp.]|nr:L,D-transpeptidase family protein [Neorhizobium sp.]